MPSPAETSARRKMLFLAATVLACVLICAAWVTLGDTIGRVVGDFLYPYLQLSRLGADSLSDRSLLLYSRSELARRLEQQLAENRRLLAQVAAGETLRIENTQLRRQMNLSPPPSWRYIDAEIILRDPRFWNERLTLNRGGRDGVVSGSAVMAAAPDGGVSFVGVVTRVMKRSAEVVTVLNPEVRISAVLPLSNIVGIVNSGRLRTVGREVDVGFLPVDQVPADREELLTTGFEPQIPAGIRIGVLSSVQHADPVFSSELYRCGTVIPSADFSGVRFVVVAVRGDGM